MGKDNRSNQINVVIVNVINGAKIAEVFRDYGVPNVLLYNKARKQNSYELMRYNSLEVLKNLINDKYFGAALICALCKTNEQFNYRNKDSC